MPQSNQGSLWSRSSAAGRLSERSLWGADGSVALGDLARGSSLGGRLEELAGRCVLVATTDQLTAALALIELDGVARRLVLCPPDLPREHVPFVMAAAAVDATVSDRTAPDAGTPIVSRTEARSRIQRGSTVHLTVRPEKCRVFATETGERLDARG